VKDLMVVNSITKVYETQRKKVVGIEKVSFSVKEGEFISIVGPSGCGKSTLLRCIAGFERTSGGQVLIKGKAATKPGPDRFMVFQGLDQLFPWLTIRENIVFAMKSVGKLPREARIYERADHYLNLVGLTGFGSFYPYQLSGGMKQRASIARALSVEPQVLLMDEPFGSLDAFSRRAMHYMLMNVWEKTRVTIIFVTHDIEEAVDLADRILVFSPGKLKADVTNSLVRPRDRDNAAYRTFLLKVNGFLDGTSKDSCKPEGVVASEVELAF
jgi:NitT/TauT family transport system ATP-binding protein